MKKVFTIGTLMFALVLPAIVLAGEAEDKLIAKITDAYGGDALLNISNYTISVTVNRPKSFT